MYISLKKTTLSLFLPPFHTVQCDSSSYYGTARNGLLSTVSWSPGQYRLVAWALLVLVACEYVYVVKELMNYYQLDQVIDNCIPRLLCFLGAMLSIREDRCTDEGCAAERWRLLQ